MPRLPRRPGAPRGRGTVGSLAAALGRRREPQPPHVVVRDRTGEPRRLDIDQDPVAEALVTAAERLIFAAQRGSKG